MAVEGRLQESRLQLSQKEEEVWKLEMRKQSDMVEMNFLSQTMPQI